MEIKHTIEILTKDIQDIEKLVRNLQNSPKPAGIELDLALSKLRNVYDILLLIKEDSISDLVESSKAKNHAPGMSQEMPPPVETEVVLPSTAQHKSEPTHQPHGELSGENVSKPESAKGSDSADKPKKEAGILAEKFNKESSLNENLGLKRSGDVTSKLSSQPIDSISRNIGINDRFFIIKELFNGDIEGYNRIILNLDRSGNFNEAFSIIENRFPETMEHTGVQILINLARRRFISSGNV
ncbi:MAG: hypothetical protein JXR52_09200 [Bacteroidales bacterium]|nr:hypothetical protein [Bacteroidales bacterium]MBN2698991.1 hypothetical protein [Bacteroidales bacterium]